MKIAIDAMGGDYAPQEIINGSIEALQQYKDIEIILVGQELRIKEELAKYNTNSLPITVVDAPETIEMGEHPANAVRKKKNSSIVVAARLVKDGQADAFISAGNSGAVMSAALFTLGRIKGILRPAIATIIPTLKGSTIVLDAGANADCEPEHLVQFGIMGKIYAEKVLGVNQPTVGILSIGEEEEKGNKLTLAASKLMRNAPFKFYGNIEGRDIPKGTTDVVVCDGFVGNIVLKLTEGMASSMMTLIKNAISESFISKLGGALILPAMRGLKRKMDYAEYGGAPLLGVDGVCIISHGSSKAKAIRNAVRVAKEAVENKLLLGIQEDLKKIQDGESNEATD